MSKKFVWIIIAILLIGGLGGTFSVKKVRAATMRGFTLSANAATGWNGSQPGPTILVEQGDTVNLVLVSDDAFTHRFFLSYHNSSTAQAGDPQSPDLNSVNSPLDYSFTATTTVATYTYYCVFHFTSMFGAFKVVPTGSIPEVPATVVAPLFMALT